MLGALFAAALAGQTPAPVPPPQAQKRPDLICRSESDPGSRFTHKVCLSPSQLRDRRFMTQQYLEGVHQQGQLAPPQPMMMGPAH